MKTQISRDSHDSEKHYSGVYQQQGRMLTDADWNELTDIVKGRLDDALMDVVGSGTPRHRKLQIVKNVSDLEIIPGYVYADGMMAHLSGQQFNYLAQPDLTSARPIPDDCTLYADVWERSVTALEDGGLMDSALYGADTCTRTKTMLQIKWCGAGSQPEQLPKRGDAELSVSIREGVTVADPCDPCAAEISLDARTGNELFRLEVHDVRYQDDDPAKAVVAVCLKWSSENGAEQYALKDGNGNDLSAPEAFKEANRVFEFFNTESEQNLGLHPQGAPLPVRGVLSKGYSLPATGEPQDYVRRWDGYCLLKKTGVGWSIEQGSDQSMADFTSSAEVSLNAGSGALSVGLASILFELSLDGQKLLAGDYWTTPLREREISAELEKKAADSSYAIPALLGPELPHGVKHHYLELARVSGGSLSENPENDRQYAFPALTEMTRLFMAGGDGQEVVPGQALPQPLCVGVANGEWPVEGATVRFQIEAGGGTLAPVNGGKTNADGIAECAWTPDASIDADYRVKATLVDPEHSGDANKDLNPPVYFYANLITANQVAYNPGCNYLNSAQTVQEALDLLCLKESGGGCCTIVIEPGDDIQARLDVIPEGGDAHICITQGQYTVKQAVSVTNAGHITIQGCGDGSFIRAPNSESVFVFNQCKSVAVRNMALQSDILGDKKASEYDHLNGALTISDVDKVVVEGVRLTCAAGGKKMASCLTVAHSSQTDSVQISQCHLNPGHQQVGMLLLNANMARINDNQITVRPKSRHAALYKLLKDKDYRLPIRKIMISNVIVVDTEAPSDARRNVDISYEGRRLRFQTDNSLIQAWEAYLGNVLPKQKGLGNRDLIRYVKSEADAFLLSQGEATDIAAGPGITSGLGVSSALAGSLPAGSISTMLPAGAGTANIPATPGTVIQPPADNVEAKSFQQWYDDMRSYLPAIASQGIVCAGQVANDICITGNAIHGVSQGIHIGLSHRASENDPDIAGRIMLRGNHVVNYLSAQLLGDWHGLFIGNVDCLHIEDNQLELEKYPYNLDRSAYGIRLYGYFGKMMQVRSNRLNGYDSGIFAKAVDALASGTSLWQVENNMLEGALEDPVLIPQQKYIVAHNVR